MRSILIFFYLLGSAYSLVVRADCQQDMSDMAGIRKSLLEKNVSVDAQKNEGSDLQDKAQGYIVKFNKLDQGNKDCRLKFWSMFVTLAAAASPFDMESQGAQVISKAIAGDKALRKTYDEATEAFHQENIRQPLTSCRVSQLQSAVREIECDKKHPKSQACHESFTYERCAGLPDPSAE